MVPEELLFSLNILRKLLLSWSPPPGRPRLLSYESFLLEIIFILQGWEMINLLPCCLLTVLPLRGGADVIYSDSALSGLCIKHAMSYTRTHTHAFIYLLWKRAYRQVCCFAHGFSHGTWTTEQMFPDRLSVVFSIQNKSVPISTSVNTFWSKVNFPFSPFKKKRITRKVNPLEHCICLAASTEVLSAGSIPPSEDRKWIHMKRAHLIMDEKRHKRLVTVVSLLIEMLRRRCLRCTRCLGAI